MALQDFIIDWAKQISGVLGVAVVDVNGKLIAGISYDEDIDILIPAVYFTEIIKASKHSFNATNWGNFEDATISSGSHYAVMKMINKKTFFTAIVDAKKGNIGLLKLKMKSIAKDLMTFLDA